MPGSTGFSTIPHNHFLMRPYGLSDPGMNRVDGIFRIYSTRVSNDVNFVEILLNHLCRMTVSNLLCQPVNRKMLQAS